MKEIYKNKIIIGADETGVGDYLTPLVAAAVYIPKENISKLLEIGVMDSKEITDKNILIIFEKIKKYIKSSVRYLDQKTYNSLNKFFNAHELKTIIHLQAMQALESRVQEKIDLIILDQYVNEKCFKQYIKKIEQSYLDIQKPKSDIYMVVRGEREHIAVAAASIIARSYLLKLMANQKEKWNTTFPLGASDMVIDAAKTFVKKHGSEKLGEVAKLSFKTTKQVI